jgi:hypothetical protein
LAGTTAIGTGVGGAAAVGALGKGIAAGTALAGAGGVGLLGKLGLSTIGTGLGGAGGIGALAPTVAAKVAPAAVAQATGSIAPSIIQSTGLEALKGKVIGGGVQQAAAQQASNLAFQQAAAKNMAGGLASKVAPVAGYNPAIAQNLAPKFLANSPPLAKPFAGETLIAGEGSPIAFQQTPQAANTFSEAGFKGLQRDALQLPSLSNPTVSPLSTTQAANPADIVGRSIRPDQNFFQNLGNIGSFQDVKDYAELHPYATAGIAGLGAMGISKLMEQKKVPRPENNAMIRPYDFNYNPNQAAYETSPSADSSEQLYFNPTFTAGAPYKATQMAEGGIASAYAVGGPVEQMAAMNSVGMNTGYPMANINTPLYSNPTMQRPEATNVIAPSAGAGVGTYSGEQRFAKGGATETEGGYSYSYDPNTMQFTQLSVPTVKLPPASTMGGMSGMQNISQGLPATPQPVKNSGTKVSGGIVTPAMGSMQAQQARPINVPVYQTPEQQLGLEGFYDYMNRQLGGYGGYAAGGGVSTLGDYSDGGRLLKGPGDGVSDSIPASIGGRQPARLADGEFVVPARIVSELGNGSTEAGARKLYAMMERIQKGRRKSVGKGKVAVNSKADKHLPA